MNPNRASLGARWGRRLNQFFSLFFRAQFWISGLGIIGLLYWYNILKNPTHGEHVQIIPYDSEILKIGQLTSRIEELESIVHVISTHLGQNVCPNNAKNFKISQSERREVIEEVQALIKNSLIQYSRNQIGTRDFALSTAGANVIPNLTSKTYELRVEGWKAALISFFTGAPRAIHGRGPMTALSPEMQPGMCWSIPGAKGQLGVQLTSNILITEISVEHISTLSAYEIGSSPKEIEVWSIDDCKKLLDVIYHPSETDTVQKFKNSDSIITIT
ncbi:SUN domain-containing protein 5 [Puccinia graminis f. sp. tritici]|uniref:SUN domain-containing protein 5 n=1 Tax=Puccinia graminis f. sp. tritici TaxID=56615 RepID=A0A5B0Q9I2_PUCGR|nr:SUN domain-containing protein 5 [Puccinia graminis f. sp. tritici]